MPERQMHILYYYPKFIFSLAAGLTAGLRWMDLEAFQFDRFDRFDPPNQTRWIDISRQIESTRYCTTDEFLTSYMH
jgi:hypothetical protein